MYNVTYATPLLDGHPPGRNRSPPPPAPRRGDRGAGGGRRRPAHHGGGREAGRRRHPHPQIDAQITAQRDWHRRQLEHILRNAKPGLLLPLPQAVAIAFVLTNPDTWRALTEESGLSQPKALALTTTTLDAALFGHQPG
jgi:hypothetical protein